MKPLNQWVFLLGLVVTSPTLYVGPAVAGDCDSYLAKHSCVDDSVRPDADYKRCCLKSSERDEFRPIKKLTDHYEMLLTGPPKHTFDEKTACQKLLKLAPCEKIKSSDHVSIVYEACCGPGETQHAMTEHIEALLSPSKVDTNHLLDALHRRNMDFEGLLSDKIKKMNVKCLDFLDDGMPREAFCKKQKIGNLNITQSLANCAIVMKKTLIPVQTMVTCSMSECMSGAEACHKGPVDKLSYKEVRLALAKDKMILPAGESIKVLHRAGTADN